MQGMELARQYYEEYGRKMIEEHFPAERDRIAVGLVGEGSECYGYDDEISHDHDYEAAFCMWLTDEDYDRIGKELDSCYQALPKEYKGVVSVADSAYGSGRRGVKKTTDFFTLLTGSPEGPETMNDWLLVPSYALSHATNGVVWEDSLGEFSRIREKIRTGMPEDVRKKKIAAKAAYMAQSGQYNFTRCIRHGEMGAAQLALYEYVQNTIEMIFLLNREYCPYYKWSIKRMRKLPILGSLADAMEALMIAPNGEEELSQKEMLIEQVSVMVIRELQKQNLTKGNWDYLEPHAFEVMNTIQDSNIRSLHVMA